MNFKAQKAADLKAAAALERRTSKPSSALPAVAPLPPIEDKDDRAMAIGEIMDTTETPRERILRRKVFITGAIPGYVGIAGSVIMLIVAIVAIPKI